MDKFLAMFLLFIITVNCQQDGKYRPPPKNNINDGKYRPGNDGRYIPSDDGKYTHIGDGDRGLYSGGGGEYTGGGGEYNGGGGQYIGGGGQYTGGSGQYTLGDRQNAGIRLSTTSQRPAITKPVTVSTTRQTVPITIRPTVQPTTTQPRQRGSGTGEGGNGWKIIRLEHVNQGDGYQYLYETENGILAEEAGRIENLSIGEEGLRATGFYQYTGPDGILYRVDYAADDNGFVPRGDHIPIIPPLIQRSLDYLASIKQ